MKGTNFNKAWSSARILFILPLIFILVSCSQGAAPAFQTEATKKPDTTAREVKAEWEQKWGEIIKEAKKEQWLVIYSPSSGETRLALTKAMKDKFNINVDWTTANPPQLLNKVLAENRAGLKVADIIISGTTGFNLKPHDIVEPLDSIVLLPEVVDPSKWYDGKFPWWDKEHMIIASLINISPIIAINTQLVEEKEITSFRDLLNLKWKRQISMTSPLIGGTGAASFGMIP